MSETEMLKLQKQNKRLKAVIVIGSITAGFILVSTVKNIDYLQRAVNSLQDTQASTLDIVASLIAE